MSGFYYFFDKKLIGSLLLVYFLMTQVASSQERHYSFNRPGGLCYLNYIYFTADSDYTQIRRPFIFIVGSEDESTEESFARDTLRKYPPFAGYAFIYLAGQDFTDKGKLDCLDALASLITNSFSFGRSNLFLQVNNNLITRNDIDGYGLGDYFKHIKLISEEKNVAYKSDTVRIENLFKESIQDYEPQSKLAEGAQYYSDDSMTKEVNNEQQGEKPQKTYFGPPEMKNFTLTGIVRDAMSGEVLPFASVQVLGTTIGTSTNSDGYFTLLKVPSDTNTIVVQYIGYEKEAVFLSPNTPKQNLGVEMKQQSKTLQEVKITAYKDDVVFVRKSEASVVKITPVKMEQLPDLGEKDVMRSFQLMPGVSASNESSSGLYVRGGTPDQNLILYDGFTVYHVDHLYGFYSAFNANALKDIQLYKGGFESKFGGRLSSVTEITSKEGSQKYFNIGGDISMLSTNLFAEIPIGKKFSSMIAVRRSYQGKIYDMIFSKFNKSANVNAPDMGTGPGRRFSQETKVKSYFYDLNGKFTYRPTRKDVVSLSIFNGTDELDNSFKSDIPSFGQANANFSMNSTDLTRYGNIGSSIKWSRKWTDKLYGNTILSYSNYYNKRDRSQERNIFNTNDSARVSMSGVFENNDLKDFSFKSDYQYEITDFSQMQFGSFATLYDIKYSYAQSDTANILDRSARAILGGLYIQNRLKLFGDKLQMTPGLRASYFQQTKRFYFEPRMSFNYIVSDFLALKGSTGKFFQYANKVMREDIMSGSKEFWILSDDESIPVSSALHFNLGLSYEIPDYTFSVEGYYKKISNLTEYSLRVNPSPAGNSYSENFFNGKGYSAGIEFLTQKNAGSLNGWVSYTLATAKNYFPDYTNYYFPANQDVRNEFKIIGMYKHKRWDFSANWIYASGRPYTAPSGAYNITLLDETTKEFFTVTSKNSIRLPDYHRLDISANYRLLLGSRGDKKRREIGSVSFSIFNVYNRNNLWYKEYILEEGEIIANSVSYLGIVPNISISFNLR
ncbi:MAG TPA: TonB-dependent receptor [Bacteroidales bacterium]|nr:TonB-dependent receptor [Bacteroidales bacterium]